ncbi:MAG: DUF305 domain-containing protein [Deltaproteobacteria bacterium]|nr:DUF305 domain-containing protein [Deltaproteobacteria bacterium]
MLKYSLALASLLTACGDTTPSHAPTAGMPASHADAPKPTDAPMAHGDAPAQAAPADQMFVDGMVPHHEGAVAMAQIAGKRAEHPELKAMAASMLASQQAEIAQMKSWRKAWYGSDATPAMGAPMSHGDMPGMASMKNMAADIKKLETATPFDLAFLDAMIPHHQGAVDMVQAMGSKLEKTETRELSAKILADQKKEIEQMQAWRAAWYPDAPPASATH